VNAFGKRSSVALVLLSLASAGSADARMIPGSDCQELSKPCTCADAPYMEVSLHNQQLAERAWETTRNDIAVNGGASTFEDARAKFAKNFHGDPRVFAPLALCKDLVDSKVAGTDFWGDGAELEDCFCTNVCRDIIDATIAHERTHVAVNLLGIDYMIGVGMGCLAGSFPQQFCDTSNALLLSESEVLAHSVGNSVLSRRLNDLQASDPENPEMECTWEPLPAAQQAALPAQAPQGFFERVQMLAQRFLYGAQR
jgi:hypothetical protein